jgi:hypothetical protein
VQLHSVSPPASEASSPPHPRCSDAKKALTNRDLQLQAVSKLGPKLEISCSTGDEFYPAFLGSIFHPFWTILGHELRVYKRLATLEVGFWVGSEAFISAAFGPDSLNSFFLTPTYEIPPVPCPNRVVA